MPRKPVADLRQYIMERCEPGENGCWIWSRSLTRHGYGQAQVAGEHRAHRVSHLAFKGPIPEGMCVLHECDVRACVNPEHLWLGTKGDNNTDRARKGRCGNFSRVSAADVTVIQELRSSGLGLQSLADLFGVSVSQVSRIASGESVLHV